MDLTFILVSAILLQLTAAFLALRLVWVVRKSFAWVLIAAALVLMTLRRGLTLYQLYFSDLPLHLDPTAEVVALTISLLLVLGIAWIAPFFFSIKRSEEALRLNESRLEALWRLSRMTEASLKQITDFVLEEGVRLTKSKIGYLAFMNEEETVLTM